MEDLKAKLALQEVELMQRNTDIEALIAKIGQQTDKLNQEKAVADAEEQKVRACVSSHSLPTPLYVSVYERFRHTVLIAV